MSTNPEWGAKSELGAMAGVVALGIRFDKKQVAASLGDVGKQTADEVSRSVSEGMKGISKFDTGGLAKRVSTDISEGVKRGVKDVAKEVERGTSKIPKIKVDFDAGAAKESLGAMAAEFAQIGGASLLAVSGTIAAIRTLESAYKTVSAKVKEIGDGIQKSAIDSALFGVRAMQKSFEGFSKVKGYITPVFDWIAGQTKKVMRLFGIHSWAQMIRKMVSYAKDSLAEMGKQFPAIEKQMTALTNATNMAKSAFAGMFAPLLESSLPYLQSVLQTLTNAFNQLGMFIAQVFGQSSYRMVVGFSDAVSGGGGAAGSANKQFGKLRRTLASFDELEILQTKDPLSGVGSGLGAVGGQPIYKDVALTPIFGGDFATLGKDLAEKFNKLIDNFDPKALAKKIAGVVNKGIELAVNFLTNADFKGLGKKVAELISGLFENINWKGLGQTLGKAVLALFDTLKGFIENFNWGKAGTKVADFLNGLLDGVNLPSIGKTINKAILGLLDGLKETILNFNWDKLGSDIGESLTNLFGVGQDETLWDKLAEDVGLLTDGVLETINNTIDNFDFEQAGKDLAGGLNKLFVENPERWENLGTTFARTFNSKVLIVNTAIREFDWEGAGENLGRAVNDFINEADFGEAGQTTKLKLKGLMTAGVAAMGQIDDATWRKFGADLKTSLVGPGGMVEKFTEGLSEVFRAIKQIYRGFFIETLLDGAAEAVNLVAPYLKGFYKLFGMEGHIDSYIEGTKKLLNDPAIRALITGGEIPSPPKLPGGGAFTPLQAAPPPVGGTKVKGGILTHAGGGHIKMPTLTWLGEGRKQEAVIPLERDTGWADMIVEKLEARGLSGGAGGDIYLTQPIYIGEGNLLGVIETVIDREGRLRNAPVFSGA